MDAHIRHCSVLYGSVIWWKISLAVAVKQSQFFKKHFLPDRLLGYIFIYDPFKVVSLIKKQSEKHFDWSRKTELLSNQYVTAKNNGWCAFLPRWHRLRGLYLLIVWKSSPRVAWFAPHKRPHSVKRGHHNKNLFVRLARRDCWSHLF